MDGIDDLIEDLRTREQEQVEAADAIRDRVTAADFTPDPDAEYDAGASSLIQPVEPTALDDVTIAGVDGGLVKKAFHSIDMFLVRAVAAVFSYRNGKLAGHTCVPSKHPRPRMEYTTGSDRNAADRLASLHRLGEEIPLAAQVAEQSDVLLLDGALAPQYADRPGTDSPLREQYDELIDLYAQLYENAADHDVLLAGVVEDTQSTNFCSLLRDNGFDHGILEHSRDSHLLHYLLEPGERTAVMPYAASDQHTVLSDLGEHGENLYSFYLKPVEHDRPVRIDVHAESNVHTVVDRVAGYVYATAGAHASYGIPPVIIEADKRAKLEQHEINAAVNRIGAKLGDVAGLQELRRDRRPF